MDALFLRGRAALAAGRWKSAAADADLLGREHLPYAEALRAVLLGCLAHHQGQTSSACDHFIDAETRLNAEDQQVLTACVRIRRGMLVAGAEGRRLQDAGEAYLTAQGVVRPERMTRMLLPGV